MAKKKTRRRAQPARQYTPVEMRPIDKARAEFLARQSAPQDVDTDGRDDLMELIAGIAAIDDHMERQEVAYEVLREIYQLNDEHAEEVNRWMQAKVYGEQ